MERNFQSVGSKALVFSGTALSSLEVPSGVPLGMLRTGQITIREAFNLFMQSYSGRDQQGSAHAMVERQTWIPHSSGDS